MIFKKRNGKKNQIWVWFNYRGLWALETDLENFTGMWALLESDSVNQMVC